MLKINKYFGIYPKILFQARNLKKKKIAIENSSKLQNKNPFLLEKFFKIDC